MTAVRIADIRAALTQGRWGYTRRRWREMPDCHGSLWLRVDETNQGLRYAGCCDLDPERMEQLVALDGMARDLLAWGDALLLKLDAALAQGDVLHDAAQHACALHATIVDQVPRGAAKDEWLLGMILLARAVRTASAQVESEVPR